MLSGGEAYPSSQSLSAQELNESSITEQLSALNNLTLSLNQTGNVTEQLSALNNLTLSLNQTIKDLNTTQTQNQSSNKPAIEQVTSFFEAIKITDIVLIIAFFMFVPLIVDLLFAHWRKLKHQQDTKPPLGIRGLYRAIMTFGIILLVGTVIFYLLSLISVNVTQNTPAVDSLLETLENLSLVLGTALATIIAFYFGMRGSENSAANVANLMTEKKDVIPPQVISNSPTDGATKVPLTELITVTFNEPVKDEHKEDKFTVFRDDTNTQLKGSISVSDGGKHITFDPADDFEPDKKYRVMLSSDIQDYNGNTLGKTYQWSFKTMAKTSQLIQEDKSTVKESSTQEGLMGPA
jgi:hypothetical protein